MDIELRHIFKKFGSTAALNDVSLAIKDGEFVTLLGPSGCGKTTLMRIVAGFLEQDEGDVIIGGKSMQDIPADSRPIGMVFQSYALFPHMTVEQNISFGPRMRHFPAAELKRKVASLLDLVGVPELAKRYPSQLSGGQQQRVAVARTLAIEPAVLLLDEPLAALDRKLRIEMCTELKKLVDRVGITTIFVTHDQEEALTMSDRIAVMDHGNVIQYGTPMQIYDGPRTTFVASFVGNSNLLRGIVQTDTDGCPILKSDDVRLVLPPSFKPQIGKEISILLRPEHCKLSPLTAEGNTHELGMTGTVSYVTQLGLSIGYEISLDTGQQLSVEMKRLRDQAPLPKGSRVLVSPIDPSAYISVPGQ